MGVNDLAKDWRSQTKEAHATRVMEKIDSALMGCAEDLNKVARTAWKPVSEPPPLETADERMTSVAVKWKNGAISVYPAGWVSDMLHDYWAFADDVVLQPPA